MATWPTAAEFKAAYKKFEAMADGYVTSAIDQAKNEIKGALAGRYGAAQVATWDTAAPPALISIALLLAYGLANLRTHVGDRATPSDQTGREAREEARKQLEAYMTGSSMLVNESGAEIAPVRAAVATFQRVTEPIFGMRPSTQWRVSQPSGSSRLGGVDGFGVP